MYKLMTDPTYFLLNLIIRSNYGFEAIKKVNFFVSHIPQVRVEKKIILLYYFSLRRVLMDFNNFIKAPV